MTVSDDSTWYANPAARRWTTDGPGDRAEAFHRSLGGYAPTRLVELPTVAEELGVGRVLVKEESSRLGLPAFKILGASYAVARALSAGIGQPDVALPMADLRRAVAAQAGTDAEVELVAATDGNHGRAVAHMARLLGMSATIFIPASVTREAQLAIASEGAVPMVIDRDYDDVVDAARVFARDAGDRALLVQDTAWPGYEQIPGWIVDGYSTMFVEVDDALPAMGLDRVDAVFVPVGVGSLAQAVVRHYRNVPVPPAIVSVEPEQAPAVLRSLQASEPVTVPTGSTIMNGLNCGTPSMGAWPYLAHGLDAAMTVGDEDAVRAVDDLQRLGVDAGPCGAATLAAARSALLEPARRRHLGVDRDSTILLLSTEGRSANPIPGSSS